MQQDLDGRVFGSPSLYGNNVYVGTERGTIYCMDAQTLTIIWEIRLQREGAIVASPAIDSAGYVYVAVSYEDDWRVSNSTTANPEYGTYSVFKLSPGGAKIWRFLSSYVLHSTPVVDETNEIVYFGGHDKRVIGIDMYTGKPRACRDASASVSSSIALLPDGSIVYSTEDGYVYACSPGCSEILWRASIAGPYVVSATQGAPARPPPPPSNSAPGQLPGYFMSSPVVLGGDANRADCHANLHDGAGGPVRAHLPVLNGGEELLQRSSFERNGAVRLEKDEQKQPDDVLREHQSHLRGRRAAEESRCQGHAQLVGHREELPEPSALRERQTEQAVSLHFHLKIGMQARDDHGMLVHVVVVIFVFLIVHEVSVFIYFPFLERLSGE